MINDQSLKNEMFPLFVLYLLRACFQIYYFSYLLPDSNVAAAISSYQQLAKFYNF